MDRLDAKPGLTNRQLLALLLILAGLGIFFWFLFQPIWNPPALQGAKRWIGQPATDMQRSMGAPMHDYTRTQIDKAQVEFPIPTYSLPDHLPQHRVLIYHGPPGPNLVLVYVDRAGIVREVLMVSS